LEVTSPAASPPSSDSEKKGLRHRLKEVFFGAVDCGGDMFEQHVIHFEASFAESDCPVMSSVYANRGDILLRREGMMGHFGLS